MKRSIGLGGAAATLVGYVVGASIFILPGELAPSTGPAVFVAYLLASVPALLSCFVTAQIGCVYPVSGAAYVAASRALSPYWGFMVVWSLLTGVTVGVALVAYGFVDYLTFFLPESNRMVVAATIVLFFGALNVLGVKWSVGAQTAMVAGFVLVLLVFGVGGLTHLNSAHLDPLFPRGWLPVLSAAIPAYFSFIGFSLLAEMAGEIRRPARTIPLALALSFACVVFLYVLVPLALVAVIPWTELQGTGASVGAASARFLPSPWPAVISAGALLAAVTTLNGIVLTVSRDVFALARDGIFPDGLARVHPRYGSPHRAIGLTTALALAGVLAGTTITAYAVVAVMAIMVMQVISAAAVFAMPRRTPRDVAQASFRLSPVWRVLTSWGLIAYSLMFIALGLLQGVVSTLVFVASIGFGTMFYLIRKKCLQSRGMEIATALRKETLFSPEAEG